MERKSDDKTQLGHAIALTIQHARHSSVKFGRSPVEGRDTTETIGLGRALPGIPRRWPVEALLGRWALAGRNERLMRALIG